MAKSISQPCLVCTSQHPKEAIRLHDHLVSHKLFVIEECDTCGFRYISNPPPEAEAFKYYESDEYVEHSDSSKGLINRVYHKARNWMLKYKFSLVHDKERPAKILDFGTGTGYFLNYMQSKGYETFGIEISEKARNFGRQQFGLKIFSPDDLFKDQFPDRFGCITFWHVLEHVYNPDKVLKKLRELMVDDGVMIVALPNYRCLEASIYKEYWNGYDVPRHLWHWDKSSFSRYIQRHGFKVIKTKILPLDPFYNCLISESYRKKNWAHILIPFIGAASLLLGWLNRDKASSIVYFLEKA